MSSPLADSWANESEPLLNFAFWCAFYKSKQLSPSHSAANPGTESSNINTRFQKIIAQALQESPRKDHHYTTGAVLDIALPCLLFYTLNPLARVPLLVQHDESGKSVPMWLSVAHHLQKEQTAICTFVVHDSTGNFRQPKSKPYVQFFFVLGVGNTTYLTWFT